MKRTKKEHNAICREYYYKNKIELRKKCAARQRKYSAKKRESIILSNNPAAVYLRESRKKFKEFHGISWNQVYRNGENAIKAVERAGKKCEKCGGSKDLCIHHIDNIGRNCLEKGGQPNDCLNNLAVLCRSCHATLHMGLKQKGGDKI